MNIRLFMLAMVVCVATAGCAPRYSISVTGPKGMSTEAEAAIDELLVRNLVQKDTARDIIFVAIGESALDCVDPPPSLFEDLAGPGVRLEPISRYDRSTHSTAPLLALGPVDWASDTEARIAVIRVRFGAGASDGFTARVEWKEGAWKITKTMRHWNT